MNLQILLVEKDETTADLLVPSLERKGHQVVVVHTQRQALSSIRARRPDLLVIDIVSFGGNGHRVNEAIRRRLEGIPTILLLGKEQARSGFEAEAFMFPPFTSRKLLYRVKKVAETLTSRELQAGPLSLDLSSRILYRQTEAFHLRPKEAALLAFFIQHAGQVLSRQAIMKAVWQTDYIGDTRTLTVHVRWLREKIEKDPSNPRFLRTVRGVGYRFAIPESEDL
ncbi:MAG TPA: response regulator transcription factor [Anaerolineae bacterium]|nr:response regulator transcription factor [Anaerolineae bacterium]